MKTACNLVGSDLALVYVTCPDAATAEGLARTLLTERVIACANVLPGMRSWYRWEGVVTAADEVVVLLKTTLDLAPLVSSRVGLLHPYEVPCIVTLTAHAAGPFAAWVGAEVVAPGAAS
jgi:periplasmic divalent cation tolerance protein